MKSIEFWIAVAVAIVVKLRTSERLSFWQVLTSVVVAVGSAYVGAEPIAEWLGIGVVVAAAMVALTAEGLMRWVLLAIDDPRILITLWKEFRK